jgi:hypothetical protein
LQRDVIISVLMPYWMAAASTDMRWCRTWSAAGSGSKRVLPDVGRFMGDITLLPCGKVVVLVEDGPPGAKVYTGVHLRFERLALLRRDAEFLCGRH